MAKTQAHHLCIEVCTFLFCCCLQNQKLAQTKSPVNQYLNIMGNFFSVQTQKKSQKGIMKSQNLKGNIDVQCK